MGDCRGAAVGIDLGTTYSRIAVWQNKHVMLIPNENGNLHTPSCVAFTDNGILTGDAAKEHARKNPANTISNIKRLIERSFNNPAVQNGFNVVGSDMNYRPKIVVNGNGKEEKLEPEEVASLLFGQLKEIAENYIGSKVMNAVVTVPASYNGLQREAVKQAADMAGLSVVLLEEPVAAILAYGLEKEKGNLGERNVLVFDFGGGSVDVSIVTIQANEMKVKAIIGLGDTNLGGEYFDDRLAKYCKRELMLDANENPEALRRLRSVAEKAKFVPSSADQSSSLNDEARWEDYFTLVMLERMKHYQFEPCIELVAMCLMDANVDKHQIDDVIIVGGLSNIPRVQELLRSFFEGKKLHNNVELDEAIVRDAAIQAAILNGEHSERNREENETVAAFDHKQSLKENNSTSCSALVGEHVDHENKQEDKSSCSRKNTARYASNWIWVCSLAVVATASFFFTPQARNLLQKGFGRSKQWSAERGDVRECSKFLEAQARSEMQSFKITVDELPSKYAKQGWVDAVQTETSQIGLRKVGWMSAISKL